jgi:DNA-binding NtrC family response regulator
MRSRILLLSAAAEDSRQLSQMLQGLPLIVEQAKDLQHARARLRENDYQALLTEASLPDGNWLDVLHLAREYPQELQVLVTSPQADARLWAEALNLGVYDVLAQPFYEPEVRRILSNACQHRHHWAGAMAAGQAQTAS